MSEKKLHMTTGSPASENSVALDVANKIKSTAKMAIEKMKTLGGGKSKNIFLCVGIILLIAAVAWFAYRSHMADLEYKNGLARLRSRFESISSEQHIDGFVKDLDRFVKRFPSGADKKELERVREYVTKVKKGLPLRLVIDSVFTTAERDTFDENDVFVVVAGPFVGEKKTPVVQDNNHPTFNFLISFTWRISSRPFLFDVNDDDLTNVERIGSVVVPCNGIVGWRNLNSKTFIRGFNASVSMHLIDPPDCPW